MTKPLPTLYAVTDGAEIHPTMSTNLDYASRLASAFRERGQDGTHVVPYVPASSLAAANETLRLANAEVARLRDVIAEAHDDLLDLALNDSSVRQFRAIRDNLTDALTPRADAPNTTPPRGEHDPR